MNLKGIKLTWLGHSSFRIETPAGKTIIVDPWVMGNPKCPDAEKNVKKVVFCSAPMATSTTSAMQLKFQSSIVLWWWRSPNLLTGWGKKA